MSSNSALTAQVVQILGRLYSLPGRTEVSVETKRYPRFLPAESGAGFEQRFWSFNGNEAPLNTEIAIPSDAEDIVVTWKGGIDAAGVMGEIKTKIGAAVSELSFRANWDYDVFTRQPEAESPHVVVRIFRHFSSGDLAG